MAGTASRRSRSKESASASPRWAPAARRPHRRAHRRGSTQRLQRSSLSARISAGRSTERDEALKGHVGAELDEEDEEKGAGGARAHVAGAGGDQWRGFVLGLVRAVQIWERRRHGGGLGGGVGPPEAPWLGSRKRDGEAGDDGHAWRRAEKPATVRAWR